MMLADLRSAIRSLPFRDPDALVLLSTQRFREAGVTLPFSFPDYFDVRDQSGSFDESGASAFGRGNVSAGEPEQVLFAVTTDWPRRRAGDRPADVGAAVRRDANRSNRHRRRRSPRHRRRVRGLLRPCEASDARRSDRGATARLLIAGASPTSSSSPRGAPAPCHPTAWRP
jgi:hypothetical protein